jgi:serine/threonine-protein kinase
MIGRLLDHYRILAPLGSGGMGVVWRAYDERLRREVAIKMLPEGAGDADDRARLLREARAASGLNHPNVCTVYDAGEWEGHAYIVMELVEGRSLQSLIAAAPLAPAEVARLGAQVAQGLAHAHQRCLVHRDLKTANVIVTPDGLAKVLDFGLARREAGGDATLSMSTATGTIAGTPAYLAPEVLRGHRADARADIWSLGLVLFEMATGANPYQRRTMPETLAAVLGGPAPAVPDTLPPALRGTIAGCLEADPDRRTARAASVAAALATAASAPAVPSPPATPATSATARTVRLRRGAPRGAWAGAALGAVIAVVAGGIVMSRMGCAPSRVNAIAVLPLANYSRDPDQQYFADGMTDELTATLGQVSALRVISHSSVADFSPQRRSIRDVARELGVQAVVTGSVYRSGDVVRIVVQLVESQSGRLMWARTYERPLRDVLTLQNELSATIADQIRAEVTPDERARLAAARPVDPIGFDSYLKARAAWATYTPEGFTEAQRLYRQAIDRDPRDARAWAGLSQAIYGTSSTFLAPNDVMPKSREAAERSLAADSTCADAHTALGIAKLVYDWDWTGAEQAFRRAIALEPSSSDAHWWLGHLMVMRRRFDEGIVELKRAQQLDPLSSWTLSSLAWHLIYADRLGEAADSLASARRKFPNEFVPHVFTGLLAEHQGDHARAAAELEQAVKMSPNNDDLGQLGHVYGAAGRRADAHRMLDSLQARARTGFVPASSFAMVYLGLGERESAMNWLEHESEDHSEWTIALAVDSWLDPLRGDARFAEVLKRVGLADVK